MKVSEIIWHPFRTERYIAGLEKTLAEREETIDSLSEQLKLAKDYSARIEKSKNELESRLFEEERKGSASLSSVKQMSIELMKLRRKADELPTLRTANKKLTERLERSEKTRAELQKRLRVIEMSSQRNGTLGMDAIDFDAADELNDPADTGDWLDLQ